MLLRPRREYYNAIRIDLPLNVLYAGREKCVPGHRVEGVRDHFLFHYVLGGSGRARIGGKRAQLSAGDGFLYTPGESLSYQASRDDPWEYCWVGFAGTDAEAVLLEAGLLPGAVLCGSGVAFGLRDLMLDLIRNLRVRSGGFRLRSEGYLYFILGAIRDVTGAAAGSRGGGAHGRRARGAAASRRKRGASASSYVNEVIRFIHMNYQRPVSVGAVVDYIGLERTYLSSLFVRSTGTSIRDYLIEYRMKRARELLAESHYSIAQVAESVGYPGYYTFARRFKKRTGVTPSEFRGSLTAG